MEIEQSVVGEELDPTRSAYKEWPMINLTDGEYQDVQVLQWDGGETSHGEPDIRVLRPDELEVEDGEYQDVQVLQWDGGETSQGEPDISVLRPDELEIEEPNWKEMVNKLQAKRAIQEKRIQTLLRNNSQESPKSPTSSRPTQHNEVETIELQTEGQPHMVESADEEYQEGGDKYIDKKEVPHMLESVDGEYREEDDNPIQEGGQAQCVHRFGNTRSIRLPHRQERHQSR